MERSRFSLLLLDPGEIFFEDFAAVLVTTDATIRTFDRKKLDGRLHLCSRSLVFDPSNVAKPMVKIPYKDCNIIEQWKGSRQFIDGDDVFRVECRQYVEMLERNILAPYRFCGAGKFLVSLTYAKVEHCLPQIMQLKRASTLSPIEHNDMIATIVYSRHSRTLFDPMWLDLYERIESETQGNKISPLVINPGRIVLSTLRLYFQPYNKVESPVTKIDVGSMQRILKRRFLLRHIGLEIYYRTSDKETHIYLSFLNQNDRDELYGKLMRHPELKLSEDDQEVMTLKWQNGIISNYDYLLYVNSLGDRTKNDFTQYPVFPWIILDYSSESLDLTDESVYRDLSLPMGAVNPSRLAKLLSRLDEMPEPKYIYGSHYSTPSSVLFYLVRLYPEYMLCLQTARFDHPDRMFNSLAHVCKNSLNDTSDFKELIPEFYDVEHDGRFLVNGRGIDFGHRHDNVKVNDVELPPWAKSPGHFVRTMRDALESEYVSNNLHNWIDLIFGYKQRGDEAIKAHNLFYYLCYEGGVDLDAITDLNQRHALEVQIMDWGQIPKQVFKVPHPRRRPKEPLPVELGGAGAFDEENEEKRWKPLVLRTTFSAHKNVVEDVLIAEDCDRVISVGHDAKMKVFSVSQDRQIRSAAVGSMRLSCCVKLPDLNLLLIANYANEIVLYDLDFGRVERSVRAHDDSITCLLWVPGLNVLFSGSNDFNVCMWKGVVTATSIRPVEYVMRHFDHDSHVKCLSFDRIKERLAVGTGDGEICIWNVGECVLENKFPAHSAPVTSMDYSEDGLKLASCSLDRTFQVLDINTGLSLYRKTTDSPMTCLKWDVVLLIGSENGVLYVWDMLEVKPLQEIRAHEGAIMSVDISKDKKIVVTGGVDSLVKVWSSK